MSRITSQAVGAYGEKAVEAELLRHGWIPSNVNATVKNATDFDIFALKNERSVLIRVKTCAPGMRAFQFSLRPGRNEIHEFSDRDFSVLVEMGMTRNEDAFFVIPTVLLRQTIYAYRDEYLSRPRRDGQPRANTGHWTLNLRPLQNGEVRQNYGLENKWASYRNSWTSLETDT